MGSYDDEKKGGIFPTHTGPHIGTSKARGMLDNIGGSAGAIRTQQWIQPDGSTTRLKTKDGMPEFITEKRNSAMAVCSDKFFGIPTSSDHELGYTPNGYVGPVCVWKLWPKFTRAPDSPEELVPIAPLTTTVGLDTTDNMPGCVTWFSELAKADGKPIVVSWAGPVNLLDKEQLKITGGKMVAKNLVGCSLKTTADTLLYKNASPFYQIHSNIPPTLIIHGTKDIAVPYSSVVDFYNQLKNNSEQHQMITLEGKGHLWSGETMDNARNKTIDWFKQNL